MLKNKIKSNKHWKREWKRNGYGKEDIEKRGTTSTIRLFWKSEGQLALGYSKIYGFWAFRDVEDDVGINQHAPFLLFIVPLEACLAIGLKVESSFPDFWIRPRLLCTKSDNTTFGTASPVIEWHFIRLNQWKLAW